ELTRVHATGQVHGFRGTRRIRLALFDHLFGSSAERPRVFAFGHDTRGVTDESEFRLERADLALALAGITTHPEPTIDRLLRDPSAAARDVLRDLLLQRSGPIETMLRDRAQV